MKMLVFATCMLVMVLNLSACNKDEEPDNTQETINDMKLKITVGTQEITATMYDNATTQAFIAQLPLTITLTDYAGTEKVFNPPSSLSTTGAPSGYAPSKGDITYYAPWGNIAVFHKDFSYSSGLINLGEIDGNGIEVFNVSGTVTAKFEIIE